MMKNGFLCLILGYVIGVYAGRKPLYYVEYYCPEKLNPRVEKVDMLDYVYEDYGTFLAQERCDVKNRTYYEELSRKKNE